MMKVKDFEMGRLLWITWVGLIHHKGPYKWKREAEEDSQRET